MAGTTKRAPLFGPLPARGIWTPLGLSRNQFLAILGLSLGLFVLVGGPVWRHLHDGHMARLAASYAVVPLGVAAALRRNGSLRPMLLLGGALMIGLLKLVLTAGLIVLLGVARAGSG